jgi:hypothetical protein
MQSLSVAPVPVPSAPPELRARVADAQALADALLPMVASVASAARDGWRYLFDAVPLDASIWDLDAARVAYEEDTGMHDLWAAINDLGLVLHSARFDDAACVAAMAPSPVQGAAR